MKQNILLLHGALGSAKQFDSLAAKLSFFYNVHRFDFKGHGTSPLPHQLTVHTLTAQLETWIAEHIPGGEPITVFGYSMGGYVALLLALEKPALFKRIVTLGTKLNWSPEIAAREVQMLDAAKIEAKVPAFAAQLHERHGAEKWKTVLKQTADLMTDLGAHNYLHTEQFQNIKTPVLLLLGDRDKMVTSEETFHAYKNIPGAALGILPDTAHLLEQVNDERLVFELKQFV